jgi:DNA-binding Lrp family transcriptional regulator
MSKENDSGPDSGKNPPANPGRSRFAVNTTRLLRDVNARQCLVVLRDKGPLSRAEIARVLGITRATAGNAVRELIASGLVTAAGETNDIAQVGRPGANLHLDPEGAFFIGVEVQKKLLTIQLFNFTLAVCATRDVSVSVDLSRVHTIASKIAETSLALIGDAGLPQEKIYGLGVSVPGIVSSAGQVIIPSVPKWEGVDLKALLSAQLPKYWLVKICNNAAAVAFSLCESLPEQDQHDFLFILLSQGVGSALVRHGKVQTTIQRGRRKTYVPDPLRLGSPLASPLGADLHGLPSSFLLVASHDPLFDENIAMAGRLGLAGCEVLLKIYPGTVHGFLEAESIVGSKLARRAPEDLGEFVSRQSGAAIR